MKRFKFILTILLTVTLIASCNKEEIRTYTVSENVHYDFTEMDNFFKKYVTDGKVNYSKVKEDKALDKIVEDLKNFEPYAIEDNWERLAFWINVYNVYTIKLITDYYPVESILDIEGKSGMNPFEMKFIEMKAGRKFSLDEIEKKIIIPKYDEPRIHYALVCAAESCPVIIPEAYTPEKLNEQLDRQAAVFLNDKSKNVLYRKYNEMFLSMIYKWYRRDFVKKDSSLINHVTKYINNEDKDFIIANNITKTLFLDYNWKLNDHRD
jgi:hypothetical protein